MSRAMIGLAFLASLALVPHQFPVLGRGIPMASSSGPSSGLLQLADLSAAGCFLSPALTTGAGSIEFPTAMRYVAGVRHYYTVDGTLHINEYAEPTLSSCSTAISSMNTATAGTDWGIMSVNGSQPPGDPHNVRVMGLKWDSTLNELVESWAGTYSGTDPLNNSIAAATFGASSLSTVGCWAPAGVVSTQRGTGLVDIPSSFLTANGITGERWGVGFGGALGTVGDGWTQGTVITAITPPSGNTCSPSNNPTAAGTTLVNYSSNTTGPNCAPAPSINLGCTPGTAPTAPFAGQTPLTNYSTSMYANFWDPYGGHGWHATDCPVNGWYDDGVKGGLVSAYEATEGWANTTVVSSGSGSFSTTWTMTVNTSTHDGSNMAAGDLMWVQTCTVGVDGCVDGGNLLESSQVLIDSVTPGSPGTVTYHVYLIPDSSNTCSTSGANCGKAVAGGFVYFGGVYAHAQPNTSRSQLRLQIFDPAQFAKVIAGTITANAVPYAEDGDLAALMPAFGANPIHQVDSPPGYSGPNRPISVITDEAHQQIIVTFKNAMFTPARILIAVLNVSHTP